eukprot:1186603-Prorocentrum_minimum.AAC.6
MSTSLNNNKRQIRWVENKYANITHLGGTFFGHGPSLSAANHKRQIRAKPWPKKASPRSHNSTPSGSFPVGRSIPYAPLGHPLGFNSNPTRCPRKTKIPGISSCDLAPRRIPARGTLAVVCQHRSARLDVVRGAPARRRALRSIPARGTLAVVYQHRSARLD